jgi:hypothetical protein
MVSPDYSENESEPSEILQKKGKRYEDTNIRSSRQVSHEPPIKYKTFLACVVEHSKCNGQIITNNFVHHCFCPCHRFLPRRSSKSTAW